MPDKTIHILYNTSAAGTVREALKQIGVHEKVIAIGDHLGYGPIDSGIAARRAWLDENLGDASGETVEFAEINWREALGPDTLPIIWTCRSDPGDYACFLEFLSRVGERPFETVDATGLMIAGRVNLWCALGVLTEEQIIASSLFERRKSLTADEIAAGRETWRRLKAENALLRITENNTLLSKPASFFDPLLLDQGSGEWALGVRLVGHAMAELICAGHGVSDSFIWWRYRALAEKGLMEIEGNGGMRNCRVRTRQSKVL
jgi:hypothetical protein